MPRYQLNIVSGGWGRSKTISTHRFTARDKTAAFRKATRLTQAKVTDPRKQYGDLYQLGSTAGAAYLATITP